jgi:hypothetical protein
VKLPSFVLFAFASLVLAGCGGDKKDESESTGAEGARIACRGNELKGDPQLPAKFPKPPEFVVVSSEGQGPTQVVVGYWESGLDEAHREWKDRLEEAGFDVTFDELEDHDSEVAYKGSGRTGIVQLRDRCTEDEVTYVRITSRPA